MSNKLRMGTRGSMLATTQSGTVKEMLEAANVNLMVEVVIIKTTGDTRLESRFQDIGSKGVFTKELDDALLANQIDFAVHSMKDLPSELPKGLVLSCVPKPEDCRDVFVSRSGKKIMELPAMAKVGTSSMRRRALLHDIRPDLTCLEWRGNIESRIKKMQAGEVDGIFLAYAGLKRLDFGRHITEVLDPQTFIPAVGQGALAIVSRENDPATDALLKRIHDEQAHALAMIQRKFMNLMEGGCSVPLGCHIESKGDAIEMHGYLSDFKKSIRLSVQGPKSEGTELAVRLAKEMKQSGADKILEAIKKNKTA